VSWLSNHFGEVAALGAASCWAVTSLVFAAASRRIGPTAVNVMRISLAWVLLIAVHRVVVGTWIPTPDSRGILLLAASGAIGFAFADQFLFAALVDCGPRLTTVVMTLTPPIAALLALPILHEPLGWWGVIGMAVTVFGVAWVARERPDPAAGQPHPHRLRGIGFTMLYCVGQALGLILAKLGIGHTRLPEIEHLDPWSASLTRITFGMLAIWTLAMIRRAGRSGAVRVEEPHFDSLETRSTARQHARHDMNRDSSVAKFATASPRDRRFAIAMLGIGAVLGPVMGVWCSLVAVDRTSAGVAFTLMSLTPLFMLPLAVWFEGERLSWRAAVGAVMAVIGVAILTSQS